MKLATTAPSGNVGRHVVHNLIRAGVRPRVLAHRPESIDPALRDRVDLRIVDLADQPAVEESLHGVDALFVTIPSVISDDPIADYERFGASIATAVARSAVGRVVLQSSVGAELRYGAGDIDGLARVEQLLEDSGASVLHLRCGFFFSNLLLQIDQLHAGEVPIVLPTDQPMPWVAPADIAQVATTWLLRPDWSGRHVQAVHGPEDLSWDDALAIVTEVTGHQARARRISDDDMRAVLTAAGMSERQVEAVMGMSTGLRDDFVPEQPRDATTTTLTSLGSWSFDVLRPLLCSDKVCSATQRTAPR
ncbi:NAD(P)H-binding protein [Nocardia vermiculata]|uniref:NAD(P)H-binding protein n=1 Tax=Nocardia vermiculata TaxID=257274 RepID=A0A846Y7K9_9NOCA|nr:NAD(P)H-binding protein [Nocardia vermiculata]NKY53238.1 NAD(P)H-binding protein [Nocardia vermiculata]